MKEKKYTCLTIRFMDPESKRENQKIGTTWYRWYEASMQISSNEKALITALTISGNTAAFYQNYGMLYRQRDITDGTMLFHIYDVSLDKAEQAARELHGALQGLAPGPLSGLVIEHGKTLL